MAAIIKSISPGTPASKSRLKPCDKIIAINGNRITDILDYKYYEYEPKLIIEAITPEEKIKIVKIKKPEGMDIGIDFEDYLMDRARSCANRCIFCFVDQMPKGMRKTLYFKDDDTRLSFLLGNYITLTNLSPREIQRIIDLHVSPVNVSVHTTNPELRCLMLGNKNAGKSIDIMRRFAEAGIVMNCQIVCCPGINDGDELRRSMKDLSDMYPGVHSVSIVPLGITKYREGLFDLTPFDREKAENVLDIVTEFGDKCVKKFGTRIFFCSDELYLTAKRPIPPDEFYEEYTQLENGVGMLRLMETEFKSALKVIEPDEMDIKPFSMATGTSAAPFLAKLVCTAKEKCDKIEGNVYAIENDFFGHTINVAGLITGQDLIAQLKGRELGSYLLISSNMIRKDEQDFLDDITLKEASDALGVPVIPVSQDGFELAEAMFGIFPKKEEPKEENTGGIEDSFYRYNPPKEGR